MKLETHIVRRLLTDESFWTEIVIAASEGDGRSLLKSANIDDDIENYVHLYDVMKVDGNKTYYVTNSVIDKLDLLDVKKCMSIEGWSLFNNLPDFKKTFILPDPKNAKYGGSRCLRVQKKNGVLNFVHIESTFLPKSEQTRNLDSNVYYIMLYVDLEKGELCEHINSEDGKALTPFLYALMCYVELCENELVEVQPKAKYGTQKSGKIINVLPFPITVINNTWNTTTVRSEGFDVIGHSAIYWTGKGRTIPKLLFIEPYRKSGYTRKSGKELANI